MLAITRAAGAEALRRCSTSFGWPAELADPCRRDFSVALGLVSCRPAGSGEGKCPKSLTLSYYGQYRFGSVVRRPRRRSRYLYAAQSGGALYQPVLLGVRDDVEPAECVVAQLKLKAN